MRKTSLSTRIKVFFFLIGLLPLLLASLLFLSITKNALKETTYRSLQILAKSAAKDVIQLITFGHSNIKALANDRILTSPTADVSEKVAEIQNVWKPSMPYDQLSLLGPEGEAIVSMGLNHSENWADYGWFHKVKEEKVAVLDLYLSESSQTSFIFGAPVLDSENRILSIVIGQILLQRIWEITDKSKIGLSGYVLLIDKTGTIWAHPDKKMILKSAPDLVKKILQTDLKRISYSLHGKEVLAAFSPLTSALDQTLPEWYAVAIQPESEAFVLIKAIESWTWIMLGIGLFFFLIQALESYTKKLEKPIQDRTLELEIEREKVQDQAQKLAMVNDITQMISSTLNLEEVLQLAVTTIGEVLEANQCLLMLTEKGSGYIRSRYEYHQSKSQTDLVNIRISLERYPELKKAIETQKPVLVNDVRSDPLMQEVRPLIIGADTRSILVFPLVIENKVLGLLVLRWHQKAHLFKKEDTQLGEAIANQIAIALNNAQLFREERKQEQLKNEVITMTVHDLKTPLTAIIGFSELLLRTIIRENRSQDERYLRNILYYANFLLNMIHSTLEIHKMESRTLKLEEKIVSLPSLIQAATRQFEILAEQEKIALIIEIPENLPPVQVDNQVFIRVLANILHNGIKHTRQGGKIVVQAEQQEDGETRIKIQDTGIGIPAQYLDKIFDKFVQIESQKTGTSVSVGLGLYFCKLAMEAHGGQIWVESQEGKGSTFYLTIPSYRVMNDE